MRNRGRSGADCWFAGLKNARILEGKVDQAKGEAKDAVDDVKHAAKS